MDAKPFLMTAKHCAIFFLFIFSAFIAAPAVVHFVNPDADTSIFYNLTEEEKKNSNVVEKDCVFTVHSFANYFSPDNSHQKNGFIYVVNKYPAITINQHCPPPENNA